MGNIDRKITIKQMYKRAR